MKVTFVIFTLIATVSVAAKEPAMYNNTKAYMVAIEEHLATLKDAELSYQLGLQEAAKLYTQFLVKQQAMGEATSEPPAEAIESSEKEKGFETPTGHEEQKTGAPPLEHFDDFEFPEKENTSEGHTPLDFDEPEIDSDLESSEKEKGFEPPALLGEKETSVPENLDEFGFPEKENTSEGHSSWAFDEPETDSDLESSEKEKSAPPPEDFEDFGSPEKAEPKPIFDFNVDAVWQEIKNGGNKIESDSESEFED